MNEPANVRGSHLKTYWEIAPDGTNRFTSEWSFKPGDVIGKPDENLVIATSGIGWVVGVRFQSASLTKSLAVTPSGLIHIANPRSWYDKDPEGRTNVAAEVTVCLAYS